LRTALGVHNDDGGRRTRDFHALVAGRRARIMAHEATSIPALRPLRRGTIEDALRAGYGPQNLRLLVPPPVERQVKVAPAFLWQ
jgi:hypothetical protein